MASYTATQSGNWSAASTWGNVGVPGNGDTATIPGFTVTVDVNTTVGTSSASGTAVVILNNASSLLIVASGVMLTMYGDISLTGSTAEFRMNAGSSLVFDSTNSASPTTTRYSWDVTGSSASININGSSGSRCSVSSNITGGALPGYMNVTASVFNGSKTVTYCDFTNVGDSTHNCLYGYYGSGAKSVGVLVDHCTFNACGQVQYGAANMTGGAWSLQHSFNIHTNTPGATVQFQAPASGQPITTGTRLVQGNYWDRIPNSWTAVQGFTIDGNDNNGGNVSAAPAQGAGQWAVMENCIETASGSGGGNMNVAGNVTNCLWLHSGAANPHYMMLNNTAGLTISGVYFEDTNTSNDGQGDCVLTAGAGAFAYLVQNCVVGRTHGGQNAAGVLLTHNSNLASLSIAVNHNTVYVGGQPGSSFDETTTTLAGSITSYQNNLHVIEEPLSNGNSRGYIAWYSTNTISGGNQDVVSPSNCDYNSCGSPGAVSSFRVDEPSAYPSNTYGHAGNSFQINASAYCNAHGLNNVDPQLIGIRDFGSFYTATWGLGQTTTGSYAGDCAAVHTWISQAPQTAQDNVKTRIQHIYNAIMGGWVPTNPLFNFVSPGDTNAVTNQGAQLGQFTGVPGFIGCNRTIGTQVKASKDFVGMSVTG